MDQRTSEKIMLTKGDRCWIFVDRYPVLDQIKAIM